ncbi:MAG: hypothetical protein ACE5NL_01875, partial [Candidatus Hydrothermarchaeaceae archaeon]
EIIENNDFTIKGNLEIGEIGGFSWEDSRVTRVYDVIGKPNAELTLRKEEETVWQGKTDENGKASFSIKFDDTNFYDSWELKDNFGARVKIDFFSATPIKLDQGIQAKFILMAGVLIIVAIVIFLFWRKYSKKEKF